MKDGFLILLRPAISQKRQDFSLLKFFKDDNRGKLKPANTQPSTFTFDNKPFDRDPRKNKNNCYGLYSDCRNDTTPATGVNTIKVKK